MPTLTITTPADGPQRYEISPNRETVTLGRSSKSDIKIICESVSGEHATIRKLDDGYVLRDLGSTNGTKLDGKKVSEIHLESGQDILLGDVGFEFVPEGGKAVNDEDPKTQSADSHRSGDSAKDEGETEVENNPVVLGLSLLGGGLIALGFVVLVGMDAIKGIAERGSVFLISGGGLIVAGLLCLAGILFATGRIRIPKLVVQFEDREEEAEPKDKKKRKADEGEEDDADSDQDSDEEKEGTADDSDDEKEKDSAAEEDSEDSKDEDDLELGRAPKPEDEGNEDESGEREKKG